MHRKKVDIDRQGAKTSEPIFMKLSMFDYVRDPTPHDKFGGGSSTLVVSAHTWHVKSRSFFSFFLSFFASFATRPGRISWPIGTIYTLKRVFPATDVPFGGLDNIWPHSGGQTPPPKTSPKLARIGILQPNQRRDKIAIYLSPMNIFVSILTRQIDYTGH